MAGKKWSTAIVGCGAITELGHLPGIALSSLCRADVLVDLDTEQALKLASAYDVDQVQSTIEGLGEKVDIAVVAVPHRLHHEIVINLLRQGIHVLVEKPIAINGAHAMEMMAVAEDESRTLGVAMVRRFFTNDRFIKRLVASHWFGELRSFHMEDGREFSWPIRTPFLLDREGGGGILIGNGSHVFDLVHWWFGEVAEVDCQVNSLIGLETEAVIDLKMSSGLEGSIELSRTRDLGNNMKLVFEHATVVVPQSGEIQIQDSARFLGFEGFPSLDAGSAGNESLEILMKNQIDSFVNAISEGKPPEVSAEEGVRTIELIERCYDKAVMLHQPWDREVTTGGVEQ